MTVLFLQKRVGVLHNFVLIALKALIKIFFKKMKEFVLIVFKDVKTIVQVLNKKIV